MLIASCVLAGAMAGLLAGLLGIGGGLLMVPALLTSFSLAGVPPEVVPTYALGTSLAGVAFASAMASREQLKMGHLRQPLSRRTMLLVACLAIGVALGTQATTHMPAHAVRVTLAVYQLAVGVWMLWRSFRPGGDDRAPRSRRGDVAQDLLAPWPSRAFMVMTGALSAAGGVGGAILMRPYFASAGMDVRRATALSSYFGTVIGVAGVLCYGLLAQPAVEVPWSLGFVNLPASACLAAGAGLLVRPGARLSQRMSKTALERAFAMFLVACAGSLALPLWRATFVAGA